MQSFSDYLTYTQRALESVDASEVEEFIDTLYDAYQRQATVFVIGNGGSAANASHFAQDLAKMSCRGRVSTACTRKGYQESSRGCNPRWDRQRNTARSGRGGG